MPVKILVTGGTGFVGAALVSRLRREGYHVESLGSKDGDIDSINLFERFGAQNIERVVHVAGKTFIPLSWNNAVDFYRTNVLGTVNVADFCRQTKAALTYISAYVYGIPEILPISESNAVKPNNPYAHSKYMGEQVCQSFHELFSVPVTILRPFNIYGAGQATRFLIPGIVEQARHAEKIELDNLAPRRDYIYIDDLIDAIMVSWRRAGDCAIYNLGSGASISVAEIVEIVQERLGTQKPVISRNVVRENEILDVVADNRKFCSEFSWQPRFSFSDGIDSVLGGYHPSASP